MLLLRQTRTKRKIQTFDWMKFNFREFHCFFRPSAIEFWPTSGKVKLFSKTLYLFECKFFYHIDFEKVWKYVFSAFITVC